MTRILLFDIGSNSVRTAVCETAQNSAFLLTEQRVYTTRLAEGLLLTGRLSKESAQRTLDVIARVLPQNADCIPYAYATSAVRDASNRDTFVSQLETLLGAGHVRVLNGEEEAAFALLGAGGTSEIRLLDLGGGSTQLVCRETGVSVPFGCIRAHNAAPFASLLEIKVALIPHMDEVYRPLLTLGNETRTLPLIGVGGTITTLALLCEGRDSFDPSWREHRNLRLDALIALLTRLDRMGDAARADIPLLRDRHDVILHGGCIVSYLMSKLNVSEMQVSIRDGLWGYGAYLMRSLNA